MASFESGACKAKRDPLPDAESLQVSNHPSVAQAVRTRPAARIILQTVEPEKMPLHAMLAHINLFLGIPGLSIP